MSWWQKAVGIFRSSQSIAATRTALPTTASQSVTASDTAVSSIPEDASDSAYALYRRRPRFLSGPFEESDVVVLRDSRKKLFKLSRPLAPGNTIGLARGHIAHESLIGKCPGDVVEATNKGTRCRVEEPSLADYVRFSKRVVTPIYPDDAETIVSRLDINAAPIPDGQGESHRFEILEAGTGHGALTLYLSRAISAFNPSMSAAGAAEYETWRKQRRAVIHSVEVSGKHSRHARRVVKEFRRGIYFHNIDFHVGDVSDWMAQYVQSSTGKPRLAHAFLDLPSPVEHLDAVSSALVPSGKLLIFAPSITTILECYRAITVNRSDLYYETTIEFGNNGSSGGREWDLRHVIPRKFRATKRGSDGETGSAATNESEMSTTAQDGFVEHDAIEEKYPSADIYEEKDSSTEIPEESDLDEQTVKSGKDSSDNIKWVCRPKVGDRINGGGFLGIFVKRTKNTALRK